ncbi:hypothetical protein DQQ01_11240 [Blautia argi]|uniref:Uncharacterized protein n=1 Tax=Blautia argi TaxID=1912897 RepID=A0A2Z4UC38_9FIRM|nr:hypothetical protein DQQ01_11240 [Blautia argi]
MCSFEERKGYDRKSIRLAEQAVGLMDFYFTGKCLIKKIKKSHAPKGVVSSSNRCKEKIREEEQPWTYW